MGIREVLRNNKLKYECIFCRSGIICFRDALSYQEFDISGLCQECQDEIFPGYVGSYRRRDDG